MIKKSITAWVIVDKETGNINWTLKIRRIRKYQDAIVSCSGGMYEVRKIKITLE